jgi:hypothetical protein
MNDNNIINIISRIHFIIISAFSFLLLSFLFTFIVLQNGIYLESIPIKDIAIKEVYIKWDKKINIFIKEIKVKQNNSSPSPNLKINQIDEILNNIKLFNNLFEKIIIENLYINKAKISLLFIDGKTGFFNVSTSDMELKSKLMVDDDLFRIDIDSFKDFKRKINANGVLILDTINKLELYTKINVNINNDANLNIYTLSNIKELHYNIESLKDIKSIGHIISMFNMSKNIKYWVYDAIDMSSLNISKIKGSILYSEPKKALKNLHIKATVKNLNYIYHRDINSVNTAYTNIEFKNSILYIRPHNTYSYGMFLEDSWVKIDFSKKEELLTLYLLFDGVLNDDILHILNTYKIKLPFKQTRGTINTDLKIEVNLRTIDVKALGKFYAKDVSINYAGLDIDIFDTNVKLNTFDVIVNNMHAKYKDIAKADVDLNFNAKNFEGLMNFRLKSLKEQGLELNQNNLNISYLISPKQDYINIDKSSWLFKDKTIDIKALKIPFNTKNLTAKIPTNLVTLNTNTKANVTGKVIINPLKINLDIDLKKLDMYDFTLDQNIAHLKLQVEDDFKLYTNQTIKLKRDNISIVLNNIKLDISDNNLSIDNLNINIDDIINTDISLAYNIDKEIGEANVHKFLLSTKSLGKIFNKTTSTSLKIKRDNDKVSINCENLDLDFLYNKSNWNFNISTLSKLVEYSPLLKTYSLNQGEISIYKKQTQNKIFFEANTKLPHKILVQNNIPIKKYFIKGSVDKGLTSFNINNLVKVKLNDEINIQANKVGVDVNEILKYLDTNSSKKESNINLRVNAKNSYIYLSKDRRVLADTIDLTIKNDLLDATLTHDKGTAWFSYSNGSFMLYGNNFGDKFMDKLFALSKHKDGKLEISIYGRVDKYEGMIYVEKTTIRDFILLNNILAFVNTIPSLITFSLPGYNSEGLKVDNAYVKFNFENDIYLTNNLLINSKEMKFLGKGVASLKYNILDLDLNLKTDLGSSAYKIPVVGYIIFGEDSVSTSLKIEGALDDPQISTTIAKDIIIAPLNILKRIFLVPYHLFKNKE